VVLLGQRAEATAPGQGSAGFSFVEPWTFLAVTADYLILRLSSTSVFSLKKFLLPVVELDASLF
jgi:hypothetical protein